MKQFVYEKCSVSGAYTVHGGKGSPPFAEFYKDVSGYYVVEFYNYGFCESWALRQLADKLDELNAEWDAFVQEDLKRLEELENE